MVCFNCISVVPNRTLKVQHMLRSAFLRIPLNCNWAATRFDMWVRAAASLQFCGLSKT